MTKLEGIKVLYIKNAKYYLEGNNGNFLEVEIDYWNERFKLSSEKKIQSKLHNQAKIFARDLLKRKSKVNFAGSN